MAGRIKWSAPSAERAALAQSAVSHYWAIATSEDHTVASMGRPMYDSARRHMLTMIADAYGMTDAMAYRVYACIVDSGEWDNVPRMVRWVVEHPGVDIRV